MKGSPPDYLILADDDSYINVPMLWSWLYEEEFFQEVLYRYKITFIRLRLHFYLNKDDNKLAGYLYITPDVMHPEPKHMNDTYTQPLIIPNYLYNRRKYVNFISGSFVAITFNSVECLYATSLKLPYFPINDVFLGFAAEGCGYRRVSKVDVNPGNLVSFCFYGN